MGPRYPTAGLATALAPCTARSLSVDQSVRLSRRISLQNVRFDPKPIYEIF